MKKQLVFIDDSGDPGFKGSASSSAFVMAGAAIMSPEIASAINQEITNLRKELGWRKEEEFKFNKSSKRVRLKFLETVRKYDFSIYAVYIKKSNYPIHYKFSSEEVLYNWTMKELLEIIPLKEATITVDGKYGRPYGMRLKTYMRRNLNAEARKIAKFNVHDSNRDNLVQLADFIAGTVDRSLQTNKTDSSEYIKLVKTKIIELNELDLNNPFGQD